MANIGKTSIIWVSSFVMIGTLVFRGRLTQAETAKRIHSDWGYSFVPNKCWNVFGVQDTVESSEEVAIHSGHKCKKSERDSWMLAIDKINSDISPLNSFKSKKRDPYHHIVYEHIRTIVSSPGVLYEEIYPESDPLIDRKDQMNFYWVLLTLCGKRRFDLGYVDHLDKTARAKARKNHTPPKPFMELVNSFKCDKAKSVKKNTKASKKVSSKNGSHGKHR